MTLKHTLKVYFSYTVFYHRQIVKLLAGKELQKMKPDEQRMRDVLVDTIRLLCRTGVEYSRRLRVQGLLGITVDDEHVFLIHVDDFIARNCTDIDDGSCGFADECNTASHGHVVGAHVNSCSDNVSQDISGDCAVQHLSGPVDQSPKHSSLSHSTQSDVLASVAPVLDISSVAANSADVRALPSSDTQSVPMLGNSPPADVAETCMESDRFASSDSATATDSHATEPDASVNVLQSSIKNESTSDNKNEPPDFIRMVMDAGINIKTDNVVLPLGMTLCAAANQNQRTPSNLDDVDSSSADTNEDGDSEQTSESEEVEHVTVPQLDLVSSLQYNPRTLVENVSRWQVGSVQHCGSDGGPDTVAIQPAVLTGVVQTGGSHASAYYQQQVAFFVFSSYAQVTAYTPSPPAVLRREGCTAHIPPGVVKQCVT